MCSRLFLFCRHSQMKHNHKCGYEGGINRTHDIDLFESPEFNRILRVRNSTINDFFYLITCFFIQQYKRSIDTQIRGPYNANKHSSYVELVLVVDNKTYKFLDKNLTRVHQHCKDIANIINAVIKQNANFF